MKKNIYINRFSKSQSEMKVILHFYSICKKNLPHLFYEGTIAYEMMEIQDMKDLDAILVPISGGGMTAGIAIAAKGINPDIKGIKS